jgi:hypothetical protein
MPKFNAPSYRATGPRYARPEDKLRPVSMVAMDPGLRRGDEALPSSDPPYYTLGNHNDGPWRQYGDVNRPRFGSFGRARRGCVDDRREPARVGRGSVAVAEAGSSAIGHAAAGDSAEANVLGVAGDGGARRTPPPTSSPEPATISLLGSGFGVLLFVVRQRRRTGMRLDKAPWVQRAGYTACWLRSLGSP